MQRIAPTLILAMALGLSTDGMASQEPPDVTVDGLQRLDETRLDLIYALPGADLSPYQRIFLLVPQVNFVRDYKRKVNAMFSNRVTDEDIQQMRQDVARLFIEEFRGELEEGGYLLAEGAADDVLEVRPAIIDLDVLAPAAAVRPNQRSALPSAGRMTLYMELVDSVSGATLVKALDYQYDRTRVQTYLGSQSRNEQAARKILRHWATVLREGLDEAHQRAALSAAATPAEGS